jgi:hypothetical protein
MDDRFHHTLKFAPPYVGRVIHFSSISRKRNAACSNSIHPVLLRQQAAISARRPTTVFDEVMVLAHGRRAGFIARMLAKGQYRLAAGVNI